MSQMINVGLDFGSLHYRAAYMSNGTIIPVPTGGDRVWSGNVALLQAGKDFAFSGLKSQIGTGQTTTVAGRKEGVEDVILQAFKGIKRKIEEYSGEEIRQVTIAVPARYSSFRRAEILRIAEKAGFRCASLINDSTAAALAYMFDRAVSSTLLVYSMGYAGYEVSLLRAAKQNLREIAHEGEDVPGGLDFDHSLINVCLDLLGQELMTPQAILGSGRIYANQVLKIRNRVSQIKQQLSLEEMAICTFSSYDLSAQFKVPFTRALFEGLITDRVQTTMESVDRILDDANMKYADVDKVLLVGGSTHINYIQRQLEARFGACLIQPRDDMLARGAAIQADKTPLAEDTAFSSSNSHIMLSPGKEEAPTFITVSPTRPLEELDTPSDDSLSVLSSTYELHSLEQEMLEVDEHKAGTSLAIEAIESLFGYLHALMNTDDYQRVDDLLNLMTAKVEDARITLAQLRQGQ